MTNTKKSTKTTKSEILGCSILKSEAWDGVDEWDKFKRVVVLAKDLKNLDLSGQIADKLELFWKAKPADGVIAILPSGLKTLILRILGIRWKREYFKVKCLRGYDSISSLKSNGFNLDFSDSATLTKLDHLKLVRSENTDLIQASKIFPNLTSLGLDTPFKYSQLNKALRNWSRIEHLSIAGADRLPCGLLEQIWSKKLVKRISAERKIRGFYSEVFQDGKWARVYNGR